MINEIFDKALLLEQAGALKKKGFRGGFDNMDADGARLWIELNYERLRADLDADCYTPMPAVGFQIAKTAGGYRKLNRLTALDSILQMSALSVLSPWNEEHFSADSFAFRPGRGTGAALRRYVELAQQYPFAAKIDVVSCYDNIDWERLEACLQPF